SPCRSRDGVSTLRGACGSVTDSSHFCRSLRYSDTMKSRSESPGSIDMDLQSEKTEKSYLHAHRLLMRAALAAMTAFAWIFIFQYFSSFTHTIATSFACTMLVYVLAQAIMMILTPLSASHLRHGVKAAMVFG